VKLILSYLNVFSNVISLAQKNNIDLVYLYNGRFIHERAVWEACRKLKIKVLLFETTQDRYHISEFGFHNRIENQKRILKNWENSTLEISEKEKIASNYFSKFETPDNPFFQVRDSVTFPFVTPFIAYFSNSDKEAKGFWETWIEPFGSQLNAISALAIACASMNIQLVIRIHPNVAENEGGDLAEWISIAKRYNAQIFLNRKEVSTYELLAKCAAVVTYGSTVGIEAAWRGIPTAVLADCKYDELGGISKLSSQENIYHWLKNLKSDSTVEKAAIRKGAATKWAFFVETGGEKIPQSHVVYGKWGDVEILKFASVCLRVNRFQRIFHRLFFQLKILHFRYRPLTKDENCFGKFLFTT
jgi:hypothetical protein